jgi:aspartate aminotransferase-like enzyme
VVRNGWFSYRWSQIFEAGQFAAQTTVVMARPTGNGIGSPFSPPPIDELVAKIQEARPNVVFSPHVETSAGIILPDDYVSQMAKAAHDVGALVVLDCVASGAIWIDMETLGVDVLISAPQKGWSAAPSAGLVMLSPLAEARLAETHSNSFALDLKKWRGIMQAYENGGHAYHATMPTDALIGFRDAMFEARGTGFSALKAAQWQLGQGVRAMLAAKGVMSVAEEGFGAPGVIVAFTQDPDIQNGKKFAAQGLQIAAGVPLQVGEGAEFCTFRIGLFGIDKLADVPATLARLQIAVDAVF